MPPQSPSAEDLTAAIPEFAEYVRPATLLHPAAGTPGPRDSSVGGPLLWPADEPWPTCPAPHLVQARDKLSDEERETYQAVDRAMRERRKPGQAYQLTSEEAAVQAQIMDGAGALDMITWERIRTVQDPTGIGTPMVPVAQLHARDVSGIAWPDTTDVLQVLWCPNDHAGLPDQPHYYGPTVEIRYRESAPDPVHVPAPPHPSRVNDSYLLRPCVLAPAGITDLPDQDEIPEDLADRAEEWADSHGIEYHRGLACRSGWKTGGWPSWHLTDLIPIDCSCGARMRLLLTMDSGRDPDINVGRFGELRIFTCPKDSSHPFRLNIQ